MCNPGKRAKELTKHHCNKTVDDDDKTSNLLDSKEGKDKEARLCHSLSRSTTATTGAMAMSVEALVAKVVGVAISQQGTEERGMWVTHDNQLKLNDNKATYINDEHNDDTMYNDNVASNVAIEQTPT